MVCACPFILKYYQLIDPVAHIFFVLYFFFFKEFVKILITKFSTYFQPLFCKSFIFCGIHLSYHETKSQDKTAVHSNNNSPIFTVFPPEILGLEIEIICLISINKYILS